MDFADPSAPVFVSELPLPSRWDNATGQFQIRVRQQYAYVPSWDVGFYVVDISDLSALTVVGQTGPYSGAGREVALYDHYALVGGAKYPLALGYVVDIADPSAPQVVDTVHYLDGGLFDVHVEGSILFLASGHIYVVDLAQPTHPVVVDTFPEAGGCMSFEKRGNRLFATDLYPNSGLQGMGCFDVSDPLEPLFLGKLAHDGVDISIGVLNDHAWVGSSGGGVYAADVADPANPTAVVCYTTGQAEACDLINNTADPTGITIYDRYVYASDRQDGLRIYELDARGDASDDGVVTSSDIILVVNYVFKGGPPPPNVAQANTSCTGSVTASDVILLVNYVFKGANVPACP